MLHLGFELISRPEGRQLSWEFSALAARDLDAERVKEAEAQGAKELAQNLSKSEHQDVLLDSLILGPPSVSIP